MTDPTRPIDPDELPRGDDSEDRTRDILRSLGPSAQRIPTEIEGRDHLRHYRLIRPLGSGGMSVVRLARDEMLGRLVAIKSLPDAVVDPDRLLRALQDEARILATFRHPHVASIHGIEVTERSAHLILEYVEGRTLAEVLRSGPLGATEAVRIGMEICAGLGAAHDQGIVHRDLKPSNVMIESTGSVRILDFGIATTVMEATLERGKADEGSRTLVGTPRYMSPEQLRGTSIGPATDLWALGCVLFEMLTASPAFPVESPGDFSLVIEGKPSLQLLPDEAPPALLQLIVDCLEKDPAGRPPSCAEVAARLEGVRVDGMDTGDSWFRGSWSTLREGTTIDGSVPLRLQVSNPRTASSALIVEIEPCVEGSLPTGTATRSTIAPGRTLARWLPWLPDRVGTRLLPEVVVRSEDGAHEARLVPSASGVTVRRAPPRVDPWVAPLVRQVRGDGSSGVAEPGHQFWVRCRDEHELDLVVEAVERALERSAIRVVRVPVFTEARRQDVFFRTLLHQIHGTSGAGEALAGESRELQGRLGDELAARPQESRYFKDLLDPRGSPALNAPEELHAWFQLFTRVASEAPLCLCITDFDRAGPEIQAWLEAMSERARSLSLSLSFVLASHRASPAGEASAIEPSHRPWSPPKLLEGDVTDLLDVVYPGARHRDEYPQLPRLIVERTEGQLGSTWRLCTRLGIDGNERGLFDRVGDSWVALADLDPVTACDEAAAGLRSRVGDREGLDEEVSTVLASMARIGTEVPVRVLERLGVSDEQLDRVLDDLERRKIVRPVDSRLEHYRFCDPGARRAILDELDGEGSRAAAKRKRRIADALYEEYSGDAPSWDWLGRRLLDLGDIDRGFEIALRAVSAHNDSSHFAAAHSLLKTLDERSTSGAPVEGSSQVHLAVERARTAIARGSGPEHVRLLEEAWRAAERADDLEARTRVLLLQARHHASVEHLEAAQEAAERAAEWAERSGRSDLVLDARNNRAICAMRSGDLERAEELLEKNRDAYHECGDVTGEAKSRLNLGSVFLRQGKPSRAREELTTAHWLARRTGATELEVKSHVWLCNIDFSAGRLNEARQGYRLAIDRLRAIQDLRALGRAYFNLAQVDAMLGRRDVARKSLDRGLEIAKRCRFDDDVQRFSLASLELELESGDEARARESFEIARRIASSPGAPISTLELSAYRVLLEGADDSRRGDERRALLERCAPRAVLFYAIGVLEFGDDASFEDLWLQLEPGIPVMADDIENVPILCRLAAVAASRKPGAGAGWISALGVALEEHPDIAGRDLYYLALALGSNAADERRRHLERSEVLLGEELARIEDASSRARYAAARRVDRERLLARSAPGSASTEP